MHTKNTNKKLTGVSKNRKTSANIFIQGECVEQKVYGKQNGHLFYREHVIIAVSSTTYYTKWLVQNPRKYKSVIDGEVILFRIF